jgi:hypothetical protein
MRIGIVGSVLAVLGAGAAGGALYMRDEASLKQAVEARDAALSQLQQGELEAARAGFDAAALAAVQVGGFTGRRGQALAVADESRRWSLALTALAHAEAAPREALSYLEPSGTAIHGVDLTGDLLARVGQVQSDRLIDAALALERKEDVERAPILFRAAIEASENSGSPRLAEAERGLDRAEVRRALVEAEAALAEERDSDASERADTADAGLKAQEDAFPTAERDALRQRLTAVRAEVADRADVSSFEEQVRDLARRAPTKSLGTLLPEAERVSAPSLRGGYARAEALQRRLQDADRLREKVVVAARDFEGMILAQRRGSTLVFLDATEVTNEAYAEFVAADEDRSAPKGWRAGKIPAGKERHPVSGVSPQDAEAYASWKSKRLPSIEEWRAATAPAGDDFPWGSGWQADAANLKEAELGTTREVGSFPSGKGPSGGLDLIGNVREIVTLGSDFQAVGGSYRSDAPRARASSDGVKLSARTRFSDVGFRCAKELRWDG